MMINKGVVTGNLCELHGMNIIPFAQDRTDQWPAARASHLNNGIVKANQHCALLNRLQNVADALEHKLCAKVIDGFFL